MSWVFLTDSHAYKLKKPVRRPYLDYSSVDLRRRNCEEEVRLNRRLAPDVYLGVVPIVLDEGGNLRVGGEGRVIDWLVKMRRLPAEATLEHAINAGSVREADVRRVAIALAGFYRSATRVSIEPEAYRRRFERDLVESRAELLRPSFSLPEVLIEEVVVALVPFLAARKELFDRRVSERRIVEGHGDLRPEHVYLCDSPLITDCLEFNPDFRVADPADEIAYLAMECERGGAANVGAWLFGAYADCDPSRAEPTACLGGGNAAFRAEISTVHVESHCARLRVRIPRSGARPKWS